MDCSDSNAVDSSCNWQFETLGASSSPPSISLIPTSGPPGTVINVFGSNFDANVQVGIFFDGNRVAVTLPDTNGNVSADFQIFTPILGPHTVSAFQSLGLTSATFTVTSGPPIVIIDPMSGPPGTSVNVTGIGFAENSIINILYDGDIVLTTPVVVESNDIGVFSAFIKIRPGVIGNHDIAAVDNVGDPGAGATFTLTQSATIAEQKSSIDAPMGSPSINTPTQGILPF